MEPRDRVGTLGGKDIYLANWRDAPYRKAYTPALPQRQDIPGDLSGISSDPFVRYWRIDDWSGGQGEPVWSTQTTPYYNTGVSAGPKIGSNRNLVLGPGRENASGGAGADEHAFGFGGDTLYALADNNNAYAWSTSSESFGSAITMGTSDISRIFGVGKPIDDSDDWIYLAYQTSTGSNDRVQRFKASGVNEQHFDESAGDPFTAIRGLTAFQGVVYTLDQADLYTIDQTTADTRVQVVDIADNTNDMVLGFFQVSIMTNSDVGPCWLQKTGGRHYIHQYNHFSDTHHIVAILPISGGHANSLYFANGFYFVPYVLEPISDRFWIFYAQGSQQGSIGPFVDASGTVSGATYPMIAGTHGDELYVVGGKSLWAYDLRAGAIINRTLLGGGTGMESYMGVGMIEDQVLVSGFDNGSTMDVDFINLQEYDTSTTGYIETGRYDYDYPGIDKILLDVTVVTDPLPSGTTVDVDYSVDGGSFTSTPGGAFTTDAATSNTWTVSTNAASVVGKEFEFKVLLTSSVAANTPTVRALISRVTSAEKHVEWFLELDVGDSEGGVAGRLVDSDLTLSDLATVAETNAVLEFVDEWLAEDDEAGTASDVVVLDVILPERGEEGPAFASVRLRAVDRA